MNSLILEQPGRYVWKGVAAPVAVGNEALVEVLRCGVCGTDIHAFGGKQPFFSYPRRLGHELCVRIVEPSAEGDLRAGDLCAVEPYHFCGHCPACRAGKTNCCRNLQVLGVHIDGGHAPVIAIPGDKLHPSRLLSPDQLALVEPLVIGAHAVERAVVRPGEPVIVIGMGPIGLAAALFAKAAGANLACIDLDPARLRFATEMLHLGAGISAGEALAERLQDHFGQLPACVIDATGSRASMSACFQLAEHGGRIVFVGLFIGEFSIDDPNFHRRELTLLASRAGLPSTFRDVIAKMESGAVDPLPLITHRFPFDQAAERLPGLAAQPGLVKAMIDFPAQS